MDLRRFIILCAYLILIPKLKGTYVEISFNNFNKLKQTLLLPSVTLSTYMLNFTLSFSISSTDTSSTWPRIVPTSVPTNIQEGRW